MLRGVSEESPVIRACGRPPTPRQEPRPAALAPPDVGSFRTQRPAFALDPQALLAMTRVGRAEILHVNVAFELEQNFGGCALGPAARCRFAVSRHHLDDSRVEQRAQTLDLIEPEANQLRVCRARADCAKLRARTSVDVADMTDRSDVPDQTA